MALPHHKAETRSSMQLNWVLYNGAILVRLQHKAYSLRDTYSNHLPHIFNIAPRQDRFDRPFHNESTSKGLISRFCNRNCTLLFHIQLVNPQQNEDVRVCGHLHRNMLILTFNLLVRSSFVTQKVRQVSDYCFDPVQVTS